MDLGVQLDLVQKSGSWFSMGDERIGQGANSVKDYLIANPEHRREGGSRGAGEPVES